MILWVYLALLIISLVLVTLSLLRDDHTELGIAGFTFLFILSFVMIAGDIQYKVGVNETNTYACVCCEQGVVVGDDYIRGEQEPGCTNENASIVIIATDSVDVYDTWSAGGTLSHTVGYLLAVISVIGLIGTFVSIKPEGFMQ